MGDKNRKFKRKEKGYKIQQLLSFFATGIN